MTLHSVAWGTPGRRLALSGVDSKPCSVQTLMSVVVEVGNAQYVSVSSVMVAVCLPGSPLPCMHGCSDVSLAVSVSALSGFGDSFSG